MESQLREEINKYITDLKMQGSSMQTIKSYIYYLKKFASFMESNNMDFLTFTPSQARLYRNYIIETGLQPRTTNKAISTLKGFYNFLIEEGKIIGNPIITRRLRVKEGQALPRFMTARELEVFTDWLTTIPDQVAMGFRTMLATGMRLSEVIDMKCSDLIRLENSAYIIRVRHGKGNKERYVPVMDADVARRLAELKKERPTEAPLIKVSSNQYGIWSQKCKNQTGIDFYPHRCRHTVGTQLLQKGVDLDKVQEVLGHEYISTTRRYAKTAQEAILELAAKADMVKESVALYRFWLR
ncbi:integrase/recombinase XerC [Desulfotomaculum arcticum]|uniref:Integrase/recombinase XerC n=1 Tax=Desulfotruncus arcticus DSM 17038 TaxID=1121424 RepID=A0A1I2X1V2_9FIRM|nr:tyrosine-type recombinase/integrase [Desulfotruncus arcticus]SFH07503.1 integrase/recombinase XerC [Desulfotomaculum arcticum] [Desulfotruncus arcticus DSM 17038]